MPDASNDHKHCARLDEHNKEIINESDFDDDDGIKQEFKRRVWWYLKYTILPKLEKKYVNKNKEKDVNVDISYLIENS